MSIKQAELIINAHNSNIISKVQWQQREFYNIIEREREREACMPISALVRVQFTVSTLTLRNEIALVRPSNGSDYPKKCRACGYRYLFLTPLSPQPAQRVDPEQEVDHRTLDMSLDLQLTLCLYRIGVGGGEHVTQIGTSLGRGKWAVISLISLKCQPCKRRDRVHARL